MADIKLPALPETGLTLPYPDDEPVYTVFQLRARDLEVTRCVLEAAAKVCDLWATRNAVYVNGAIRSGEDIRNLKVSHD